MIELGLIRSQLVDKRNLNKTRFNDITIYDLSMSGAKIHARGCYHEGYRISECIILVYYDLPLTRLRGGEWSFQNTGLAKFL